MLLRKFILVLLLYPTVAYANFGLSVTFEVRTTGNDSNGGCFDPSVTSPGIDYTQQDTPQITYSDLVLATTTTMTSAANPFTANHVGSCIHITGGTGFTTGWYEITAVNGVTNVATVDRVAGTASSTGGTGLLGGALKTWTMTINTVGNLAAANAIIWLKCGTYVSTANATAGATTNIESFVGYNTTRGDNAIGCRPLITTATNSTILVTISTATQWSWSHIDFTNTATTRAVGFNTSSVTTQQFYFNDVTLSGFTSAVNGACSRVVLYNTIVKNSSLYAIVVGQNATNFVILVDSVLTGNAGGIQITGTGPSRFYILNSIIANNTAFGITATTGTNIFQTIHSAFVNNTSGGVTGAFGGGSIFDNSIFWGNGTYGFQSSVVIPWVVGGRNNAYGGNTTGGYNANGYTAPGDVTLTADPFNNDAGGDFSLNNTSGGGAALKNAGFPSTYINGVSVGYPDIGPVEAGLTGGGSAVNPGSTN